MEAEDMRGAESLSRGRIEESKKGDTIIEGDILGLKRNQALGNVWRPTKMTPTNNLSNRREATVNALP